MQQSRNKNITHLDDLQRIILNANSIHIFNEKFIIINGNKLNIDESSLSIIEYLYNNPNSLLIDLYLNFKSIDKEKIQSLIFNLAIENIIGLVR